MSSEHQESMPGRQPLSLSTDEPVDFTPPAFSSAGQSMSSVSPSTEPSTIPGSLPPPATGAVPESPPTGSSRDPSESRQLAERLIVHALRLSGTRQSDVSPLDLALAKSASLILLHLQDRIEQLLAAAESDESVQRRPAKRKDSKSKRK